MTSIWWQSRGNAESDGLVPVILETLAINQYLQLSDLIGRQFLSETTTAVTTVTSQRRFPACIAPVKSMPVDVDASVAR
jgi:hypothetical protein